MINMPDVDALMAGGLGSWLDAKTAERAKAREKVFYTQVTGGIVGVVIVLVVLLMGWSFQFAGIGAVVVGGLFFAWANHIRQTMVDSLKQEMNGALAGSLGIHYLVAPACGPEFDLAAEYDLLPTYDDRYFQDQWQGEVEGTQFLLYEAKLTEERGSGKSRRTVTVFQGIILRFRFARDFIGTTLVRREGFKFTLFGDSKSYGGQQLERLKMVDPRFEDAFDVYGSDPVEGRYLVHPAYCERLLELERDFAGEKLCALFHGGDLLVTIHAEDLFESATLNPEEDRALLGRTIEQFASITRMIQTLNERPRN
jgi:Protein of unknown function (DUF3137)